MTTEKNVIWSYINICSFILERFVEKTAEGHSVMCLRPLCIILFQYGDQPKTSIDVRFWRLKSLPALTGLIGILINCMHILIWMRNVTGIQCVDFIVSVERQTFGALVTQTILGQTILDTH